MTPRESETIALARSYVGMREVAPNSGPVIDQMLAHAHCRPGAPYCAAFVAWCGDRALGARSPYPRSAWSPDHVRGGQRLTSAVQIRGGETFGIWFASKNRVAHTGLIVRRIGATVETIEANTSGTAAAGSAADREGQGVFRKLRPATSIYRVRDWIGQP
jgi:hypothetical protein